MHKINFTAKDNFPFSSDAASMMQDQSFLASKAAFLGGRNYILDGCDENGNGTVSDGVIVINGEFLPFVGGEKKDKITIKETKQTLVAFDEQYPEAYIFRSVEFSDNGEYNWGDFSKVLTNKELEDKFESIKGSPLGMIELWSGYTGKIPDNYRLCDGSELSQEEYAELFDVVGTLHGNASPNYFRLPDMRSRFVVGYNNNETDYTNIGVTGGVDKVALTSAQMPKHRHVYSDDVNAAGKFSSIEAGFPSLIGLTDDQQSSGEKTGRGTAYYTTMEGGTQSGNVGESEEHENRPRYFVVAYVMKVKY